MISLAYADSLDLLFKPGWTVEIVDMVQHELTRNHTPSSEKLRYWVQANDLPILPTQIFDRYQQALSLGSETPRKANLGELAIQETMSRFALGQPPRAGVFLFEDHKIARASFVLPEACRKVCTRAFLMFLEQKGWIPSATDIEREAILAGRSFSSLRLPA